MKVPKKANVNDKYCEVFTHFGFISKQPRIDSVLWNVMKLFISTDESSKKKEAGGHGEQKQIIEARDRRDLYFWHLLFDRLNVLHVLAY